MITSTLFTFTFIVGSVIALTAVLLFGLSLVPALLDRGDQSARRLIPMVAGGLVGWHFLAMGLAWSGAFIASEDGPFPPYIAFGIGVPVLVGTVSILRSSTIHRVLAAVPQHWIVGVQVYRALGVIFLILYANGSLPGVFAIPAGYGDVAVGIAAPFVAYLVVKYANRSRGAVFGWNILGIGDLVLAVALGFLSSPGPLQMLSLDSPNVTVSAFPLVMVPVFAVPVSILLHVCSLTKLARETRHLRGTITGEGAVGRV